MLEAYGKQKVNKLVVRLEIRVYRNLFIARAIRALIEKHASSTAHCLFYVRETQPDCRNG
jgi:hypothetical protein